MKKLVCMFGMLLFCMPVMAETVETSSASIPGHGSHSHFVSVPRDDFSYGLGADVVVYHGNNPLLDEVRVDTRYDIDNRETSVFGVVKVDLFDYLTKR